MRPLLFLLPLLPLLCPQPARAHGGLPVTSEILWSGDTLYVPTLYWGMFVGTDGGRWRWICDEAINGNKVRQVYRSADGTFYATDVSGLTLSRDGGCSWQAVAGDVAQAAVQDLAFDPAAPAHAYVTASRAGRSELWETADAGASWKPIYALPDRFFHGLAVARDRVYLGTTASGAAPAPAIYVSADGGKGFAAVPVGNPPAGTAPERLTLLGMEARPGRGAERVLYLRFVGDSAQVLWRADLSQAGAAFSEVLRLELNAPTVSNVSIFAVGFDVPRDRMLISTGNGLYLQDGAAAPVRSVALSRAQCASVKGGRTYACSWDFFPDMAAVARSDDGGTSFRKIFQFDETQGVLECAAGTTVAQVCPASWTLNAPLLGIDPGAPGGTMPAGSGSSGCRAAPAGAATGQALPLPLLFLLVHLVLVAVYRLQKVLRVVL